MSSRMVDLCVAILEDHFGFYVSSVGKSLLIQQMPLTTLARHMARCKIAPRETKRSLAILEQHNLLHFEPTPRAILYSLVPQRILQLIRVPRAILVIKTLYEGVAEAIFEDILAQGQTSCSDCIRRVSKCLDNLAFDKIKHDFVRLAENQIVIRCGRLVPEEEAPQACPAFLVEPDPFLMPSVILDAKCASEESSNGTIEGMEATPVEVAQKTRKRKHADDAEEETTPNCSSDSDAHLLWRVNWARMERFFRDGLILDALGGSGNELLDKPALRVAQLLLKVGEVRSAIHAEQSPPISLQDVCRYVREHQLQADFSREQIDEKLNIASLDTAGIVRRLGDSGGGLYIINYKVGVELLCLEHVESAIREKVGDKAVRIFRLLRAKGHIEEEQVEKEAMLAKRETKELCCALLDNSFISIRQIARANDFAPARTIFLYSVNMAQVLGAVIHFTVGALRNVIRRRMLEREKHEPLLDRQLKMEVIINSIQQNNNPTDAEEEEAKKEQIAEVEQAYLSAEDRSRLDRFRRAERRLWSTEIELERVLFALNLCQLLRQRADAEEQKQRAQGRRRRVAQQAQQTMAQI